VGNQTFALANITSVRGVRIPDSDTVQYLLAIGGVMLGVCGIIPLNAGGGGILAGILLMVLGGVFAAAGIFWLTRPNRAMYQVFVSTAGGEVRTVASRDEALIQRVVSALNQAIIARG
jgi:outer membrane lipoprotein SlyB